MTTVADTSLDLLCLSVPRPHSLHHAQLFQPLTRLLLHESNDKYRSTATLFQWAVTTMCTSQLYGFLPYIRGTHPRLQGSGIVKGERHKICMCLLIQLIFWKSPRAVAGIVSLRLLLHCLFSPPLPCPAFSATHECDQLFCVPIGA